MHRARKRFGQNFLHDQSIISKIIDAIAPIPGDAIIEIGPGQGALTAPLIQRAKHITAIELDRDLVQLLKSQYHDEQLHLIAQDVLDVDFQRFANQLRVVGNLPYNISTPIIMHLLSLGDKVRDMHFMLQKEVVQRLAAEPGTKQYGRLSVMAQFCCQVTHLFDVSPNCFIPKPKVVSAIVRLQPKQLSVAEKNLIPAFQKIVKKAFSMRRKTLKNNLKGVLVDQDYQALNLDPSIRAEQLSLEEFIKIAQFVSK